MALPWRQTCLLLALVVMPCVYAAVCVGLSRRRQGLLLSYLAYYLLAGCAAGWFLVAGLWPSGVSRAFGTGLLTVAPLSCLGLAVALQRGPARHGFDTAAMVGCTLTRR